jgi:hypothetical protein
MDNFYRAFHYKKGLEIDVQAATTYAAQKLAAAYFKTQPHNIEVVLLARGDGVPVEHKPEEVSP